MVKLTTKEDIALLVEEASEMFEETGCVPDVDGTKVRAEKIVPRAKRYILETIDNPKASYDATIWHSPGYTLVLSWLSQKWLKYCHKLAPTVLRAHPGSLDSWRGICSKSPEHDADHGEADECSNGRCVAFEVASQATVTTDPRERSFDDPPFRQHLKSSSVRSLDDLQAPGTSAPHRHRHLASRVSAVGKNAFDERE